MNLIDEEQLHTHVILVAWLNILSNGFMVLMACFFFFMLTGIGVAVQEPEAQQILSIVGISIGVILFSLALPGIIAGIGLLMRRTWGRFLAMIVGTISLINIPIGTIIGIYTLIVLLQEPAAAYFAQTGNDASPESTV